MRPPARNTVRRCRLVCHHCCSSSWCYAGLAALHERARSDLRDNRLAFELVSYTKRFSLRYYPTTVVDLTFCHGVNLRDDLTIILWLCTNILSVRLSHEVSGSQTRPHAAQESGREWRSHLCHARNDCTTNRRNRRTTGARSAIHQAGAL